MLQFHKTFRFRHQFWTSLEKPLIENDAWKNQVHFALIDWSFEVWWKSFAKSFDEFFAWFENRACNFKNKTENSGPQMNSLISMPLIIKFMFLKKATKNDKIYTVNLTLTNRRWRFHNFLWTWTLIKDEVILHSFDSHFTQKSATMSFEDFFCMIRRQLSFSCQVVVRQSLSKYVVAI